MITTVLLIAFCSLVIAAPPPPFLGKSIRRWDQQNFFQGDIEMPEGRNALLQTSPRKWPNGIVYYDWIGQNWTKDHFDMLNEAFRMIEKHTCIKFVKHTNETNFINIVDGGGGCFSELVGMKGGRQVLSLMNQDSMGSTCWGVGTVMHELLHGVGLWHEQMRYDRDDYLEIYPQNYGGAGFQFQKVSQNVTSTYDIPYNYKSIMHYNAWAFSVNGLPTMTPKKPGFTPEDLGRGEMYEYEGDWEKVRRMYGCKGTYPPEPCADTYSSCDYYKDQCHSVEWLKSYCPKMCGFCPDSVTTPKPASAACQDEVSYCSQYQKDCGKMEWLNNSCRKTCGTCACKDDLPYCAEYKDDCKKETWMATSCRKTCRLC